jgi:hypothetical protein
MQDYKGIYGTGYKDEEGNLYLHQEKGLLLTRLKNRNGTYDVEVIENDWSHFDKKPSLGVCVQENMLLNEWRRLFIELKSNSGIKRLHKLLKEAEDSLYDDPE